MNNQTRLENQLSYADATRLINEILSILTKNNLMPERADERDEKKKEILDFIKWFLIKKNKFLIYLGAGVSKNIKVRYKNGDLREAVTQNWQELLKCVYWEFDVSNQRKFLKSASARVGQLDCLNGKLIESLSEEEWHNTFDTCKEKILQELLNKLGPFRFAWGLRWFAEEKNDLDSTNRRDEILSKIVNQTIEENEDKDSDKYDLVESYESDLLSQIVNLPFREVITTNYDHYLEKFLEEHKQKRNFFPVYDDTTLIESFQEYRTQLYYLHGKARFKKTVFSKNLVFDKYDYAQLFTKNNQILQHLVRMFLKYGVLYVGFGLDDQTFDYMESQIRIFCRETKTNVEKIPKSYAFMRSAEIDKNEERALDILYKIKVIRFEDFTDLPIILEKINKIIEYIESREIEWKSERNRQAVETFSKSAAKSFLNGNLKESIKDYRKAIAYTLFWTVEEEKQDKIKWQNIQTICELYRRLILTRSKLRWSGTWNKDEENHEIKINFEHTNKIIRDYEEGNKLFLESENSSSKDIKQQLIIEKVALKMLKARVNYHEGEFLEAIKEFNNFAQGNAEEKDYSEALNIINNVIKDGRIRKLEKHEMLLLETYYFALCQFDRSDPTFSNRKNKYVTEQIVSDTKDIHTKQTEFCKSDKDNTIRLKEFGTIAVIAEWVLAIGKLRDFSRFVNLNQRAQNIEELEKIDAMLEAGWHYAISEKNDCKPSPRWETVKHRSKCRALALIWFNDDRRTENLTEAYKSIQSALELTSNKPGLKGQHVRNLLEAVRLNTITNFPTQKVKTLNKEINSAMCFAASYFYLESAFKDIEELFKGNNKKEEPYIWWVLIQAYETACFWKLVFKNFLNTIPENLRSKLLKKFLKEDDLKKFIIDEYRNFGTMVFYGEDRIFGRIKSFEEVYSMVEERMNSIQPDLNI